MLIVYMSQYRSPILKETLLVSGSNLNLAPEHISKCSKFQFVTRQLEIQVIDKASNLGKKPVGKTPKEEERPTRTKHTSASKNFGLLGWSSLKKRKNCGSSKGSCGGGDGKQNKFSSREGTVLVLLRPLLFQHKLILTAVSVNVTLPLDAFTHCTWTKCLTITYCLRFKMLSDSDILN